MGKMGRPRKKTPEREFSRYVSNLMQLYEDLNDGTFEKKLSRELTIHIEQCFDDMIKDCIKLWYDYYTPIYYKRSHSFYQFYNIDSYKKKVSIQVEFGYKFNYKKHRVENQYIYEWGFKKGWHGGAHTINEEKTSEWGEHPDDGRPWYRTPHPTVANGRIPYKKWVTDKVSRFSAGAIKSISPYEMIMDDFKNWELGRHTKYSECATKQEIINECTSYILIPYEL